MPKNDGKYLEKAVEDEFELITDSDFNYMRLPDAKAARGALVAQPADFFLAQTGNAAYLECKSVGKTTRRLPKFDQHPRMLRWEYAGVKGFVLIHFYEPDELYLVRVTELEQGKASWVIKGPVYKDMAEAVMALRMMI